MSKPDLTAAPMSWTGAFANVRRVHKHVADVEARVGQPKPEPNSGSMHWPGTSDTRSQAHSE